MKRDRSLFGGRRRNNLDAERRGRIDSGVCTAQLTANITGAEIGGPNPEQERDPPPEATPVTFPSYEVRGNRTWTPESPAAHLRLLFAKILKPTDITDDHAEALNITVISDCSIDELVPRAADGSSYLPVFPPEKSNDDESLWDAAASDPTQTRNQKALHERIAELRVDNDLAFRVLNRNVPRGTKAPRLAYMRKFWEGLEAMSPYWDCSLDQYYETVEPRMHEDSQSHKRQRLESEPLHGETSTVGERAWPSSERNLPELAQHLHSSEAVSRNDESSKHAKGNVEDNNRKIRSTSGSPEPGSRMRYKGRRTGTGRSMPDQFRVDMVKGFVEGTIWPFRASLSVARQMPIVQFGTLNLPVRQTAAAYRTPNERTKARQGWLEGPILAVQVRSETDFMNEQGSSLKTMSRLDVMREIGGMLQLAQERSREGKTEQKPGEGKWWATKPRWGGGAGGEVQNASGNSDIAPSAEQFSALSARAQDNIRKQKQMIKERRKEAFAEKWKEVKPGRGYWDPRTEYKAIGTDKNSDYDHVYMVSSLNHHISILRMTVTREYVDCVTSGKMPQPLPKDPNWCCPEIRRSKWFDLFVLEDRLEAFRGLWGVMAYLMRGSEHEAKTTSQSEGRHDLEQ